MKLREPRVLVIDGDQGGEGSVGEAVSLLTADGFVCLSVTGGDLAEEVSRARPDVILTRWERAEAVRTALAAAHGPGGLVPVISIGRAGVAGARVHEHLETPFSARELIACVSWAVRFKRLGDECQRRERILRRLAVRDEATGVFSRTYGLERVKQEIARGKRHGYAVSCLRLTVRMVGPGGMEGGTGSGTEDEDGPRDRVGPVILQQVASLLVRLTREADMVCRYGEDGFMVLLPQTDRPGLEALAERVRLAVEGLRIGGQGEGPSLTAAIGGATFPGPEVSGPGSLIRLAGAAMRLVARGKVKRALVL